MTAVTWDELRKLLIINLGLNRPLRRLEVPAQALFYKYRRDLGQSIEVYLAGIMA
jgi:hypothetical protein